MKMSLAMQLFFFLLVVYGALILFMYLRQEAFLFFPPTARHDAHDYPDVVDYQLSRGDVTLRGWLVNPRLVRDKMLVYYGGNGEDIFHNIEELKDVNAASLLVAYRGYGPSDGRPTEADLFADALAVIDDMQRRYAPRRIFLIGRSLGSGVACYAAAKREVDGAVLVTPYDSIVNIASSSYPWLPVGLLLKHRFDSLRVVAQISCPLLVIYGGQDHVVPAARTENLIEHLGGKKEIVFIKKADHGTIDMFPEYWTALLAFISGE